MNNKKLYDQWIGALKGPESVLDLGMLERMSLKISKRWSENRIRAIGFMKISLLVVTPRSGFMDDCGGGVGVRNG